MSKLFSIYRSWVLQRPIVALAFVAFVLVLAIAGLPRFKLDASADALVLESDNSLELFRDMSERYACLLYTSPSPRDKRQSRMPSSA